jgi:adenylate cyclase
MRLTGLLQGGEWILKDLFFWLHPSALDGRPMLQTLSEPIEWLCIIFWCLFGAALGWWLQSLRLIVVGGVISVVVLVGISYLAFLGGWLLPLFPSLLGLALSSKTFPLVAARLLKKVRLRYTVRHIIEVAKTEPAAAEVALEYLKQGESDENRAYIDRMIREI